MSDVQPLTLVPAETLGTISPLLHGQFAEHLGELVCPGIWVGEESRIPNTGGLRNSVLEALRPLALPVLRWPGGNFADSYHWRDGIGPRARRPLRLNVQWGNAPETNHFGTHEFIAFCRAIGAEPYIAGNLGSEPPAQLRDWVEYCNFAGPSETADLRRANGAAEPFRVRFWGVGNENWGAGGRWVRNITPPSSAVTARTCLNTPEPNRTRWPRGRAAATGTGRDASFATWRRNTGTV